MPKGMNHNSYGAYPCIDFKQSFVIDEKEDGIVFQFGEAIRSIYNWPKF